MHRLFAAVSVGMAGLPVLWPDVECYAYKTKKFARAVT
jgi:hypothetical protein